MIREKASFDKAIVYTDGACLGNPGPGGCGVLIRLVQDGLVVKEYQIERGYRRTTNNRMEMRAAIIALEELSLLMVPAVEIYTDSKYVQDGISKWIRKWAQNGWRVASGACVKNKDLWTLISCLQAQFDGVEWRWVKGHNGTPENELCDKLARKGAKGSSLLEDAGYLD